MRVSALFAFSLVAASTACRGESDSALPEAGSGGSAGDGTGAAGDDGAGGSEAPGGAPGSGGEGGAGGAPATGGQAGADAAGACSGSPRRVCVDAQGLPVLFHGADGQLLLRQVGPAEYALPARGWVTVLGPVLVSYHDVPLGTVIHFPVLESPVPPEPAQGLQIVVPPHPAAERFFASTGCERQVELMAGETRLLSLEERCLENGFGELYVWATNLANEVVASLHVDQIRVGDAAREPLVLELPDWQAPAGEAVVLLDQLDPGTFGDVVLSAFRGESRILEWSLELFSEADESGSAHFSALPPAVGSSWWRDIVLFREGNASPLPASRAREELGPVLPSEQSVQVLTLLSPVSGIEVVDRTISWELASEVIADRTLVTIFEDATGLPSWTIWVPPMVSTLTLPSGDADLDAQAPAAFRALRVELGDHGAFDGYEDILERWGQSAPLGEAVSASPVPFRFSSAVWP